MLRIEELKPNLTVIGIIPNAVVRILAVETMGESCSVVYRSPDGQLGDRMVFARMRLASRSPKQSVRGLSPL